MRSPTSIQPPATSIMNTTHTPTRISSTCREYVSRTHTDTDTDTDTHRHTQTHTDTATTKTAPVVVPAPPGPLDRPYIAECNAAADGPDAEDDDDVGPAFDRFRLASVDTSRVKPAAMPPEEPPARPRPAASAPNTGSASGFLAAAGAGFRGPCWLILGADPLPDMAASTRHKQAPRATQRRWAVDGNADARFAQA